MSRTVFVNPFENPRRGRRRRKKSRRGSYRRRGKRRSRARKQTYRGTIVMRRNAGVAPFLQQNPLILSNPRRRRSRRRNPMDLPSIKTIVDSTVTGGGAAAIALAVNTLGTSRITHDWLRRGVQVLAASVGGALLSGKSPALGAAFTGAAMVAPVQDLAADVLGIGVAAGATVAKDADLDALAADLEDVLDEMDEDDLGEYDDGDEDYL